ncbi:MAG: biotin--[acetyl-CoA-carboxylase] ligase [Desulfobulbus sp.]|nr:biotin--[acetyl-CoA-carboxylase] ligase [Desulfobulbus sp.]
MIHFLESTDSTNRVAKEMAAAGAPAGTVVVSRSQSAGRGQYDRSFNSPPGGLYFSMIVEPALPVAKIPQVTLATGVACRHVLHEKFHISPVLKWPNDVFVSTKKIAGILCECLNAPQTGSGNVKVIIGVGLNVNSEMEQYDSGLRPYVTTLRNEVGYQIDLQELLHTLLQAISRYVGDLTKDHGAVLAEWQRYDMLLANTLKYSTGSSSLEGIGCGITPEGYYRLCDSSGQEHVVVGGQLRQVKRH